MRVLVTGGDGFLGRVLCLRLTELGHDVVRLGRLDADLTDRVQVAAALAGLDVEAVCHLAARTNVRESIADPLGYYAANLGGTLNVLTAWLSERSRARPAVFVFLSSGAVYGSGHPGPIPEGLRPQPENPYAASKLAAESLVTCVAAAGWIDAVILRCFNIGGAYRGHFSRNPAGIIAASLRAAAGEVAQVAVNGDGSAVREFTHVLDVADAIASALHDAAQGGTTGRAEVLNVGTGVGTTISDVIATARRVTGRHIDVISGPATGEAHTLLADTSRIAARLGWVPRRSGIEEVIRSDWGARRVSSSSTSVVPTYESE